MNGAGQLASTRQGSSGEPQGSWTARKLGACHSISANGASAGPEMTAPVGLNREPWHGQSQVRSASFQATTHPMWVQIADRRTVAPLSSRYAATLAPSRSITLPFATLQCA